MVSRTRGERQLEVDAIHGDVHDGKPRAQPPEDTLHQHDQWIEKTDLPLQALRLLPVGLGHVNPEWLPVETEGLVVSAQTRSAQAIAEAPPGQCRQLAEGPDAPAGERGGEIRG